VGLRRQLNEDALLSRPDLGLWAVADGMGGHDAGEVASAVVVERLAAGDAELSLSQRVQTALRSLDDANSELITLGKTAGGGRGIGATVVALAVRGGEFTCLWAGDSRAYRARAGAIAQLTKDHSLVQDLVDLGELDPAEADSHPNSNVITRAVGAKPILHVDSVSGDIQPGDVFLLASDGLTRLVRPEELSKGLAAADLDATADGFVQLCLERGAPDNLSLIIVRAEAAS
jgi:serine/threonine protein phosphatase PrpC